MVNSYDWLPSWAPTPRGRPHAGRVIGNYLLENYDAVDLNGDGVISYVMFKGQENNPEAEYRTQYSVEDANKILEENGKPALAYYDSAAATQYLVDPNGSWSAAAAQDYMTTILSAYSEANGNMVELVIANNDEMAWAPSPPCRLPATTPARAARPFPCSAWTPPGLRLHRCRTALAGDAEGMANTIATLVGTSRWWELMATPTIIVDEGVAKIRVPYTTGS